MPKLSLSLEYGNQLTKIRSFVFFHSFFFLRQRCKVPIRSHPSHFGNKSRCENHIRLHFGPEELLSSQSAGFVFLGETMKSFRIHVTLSTVPVGYILENPNRLLINNL